MHYSLIVSWKDQSNKKKLSSLTNHKNTKNGTVTGGVDRVNLFQQVELGFDKLFNYKRQQAESFNYHNTMKTDSLSRQVKLQGQEFQSSERETEISQNNNQENIFSLYHENKETNNLAFNLDNNIAIKEKDKVFIKGTVYNIVQM